MDHVIVLALAKVLAVALHDAVKGVAKIMHILRLHDMAERVLVLGPDNSSLGHGLWVVAHGLESRRRARPERCVRICVGVRRRRPCERVE